MSFKCIYCQTQNWETLVQRSRWLSHCVESQREWHAKSSVTKGVMGKMLARLHMAGEGAFEIWFMFLVVIWLRGALGFHSAGWSCSTHTVHSPFIYLLHLNVLPLSTAPVPVKGIIHPQMEILSLITHPHIAPKPEDLRLSSEHKLRYFWWNLRVFWPALTVRMGRFPDLLGASAYHMNDTMHRFKKCASATSWYLYHDASFQTYLHQYTRFIGI